MALWWLPHAILYSVGGFRHALQYVGLAFAYLSYDGPKCSCERTSCDLNHSVMMLHSARFDAARATVFRGGVCASWG